jgi:hypothetical protein
MEQVESIAAIAQVIQLAVAPVFLVAGIAGLLGVLTTRLGRAIDRSRVLETRLPLTPGDDPERRLVHAEMATLWSRIGWIKWAIGLCVSAALMICLVIVALFLGNLTTVHLGTLIAGFFVAAMLLIISGLVCLLVEISLSAGSMRRPS